MEFHLTNLPFYRGHLEKARSIAELRSPTRDDGTIARILYMLARVMQNNVLTAAQAQPLQTRAEMARANLMGRGESAPLDVYDPDGNLEVEDELVFYNLLVPVFFR